MFNIFPRKILAPEVTARRRAAVHGVQQVELLDDARRGQVIRLAHRGRQAVILAGATCAKRIHIHHDRLFFPDGIRQRDLTALGKASCHDIVNRYVKVVSCNYSNSVVRLHYSILLRFFQYLAHSGYKETDLSLKMMPIVKVSASARIPTTLDLSQIESILTSVDRESPQGKRDYAVLMIAVKLGIRTSDIRNLRPANFNWEQHLVSFTQVKTGEPITLPLPTDVGWAVIDYLKNGRPVSDAPEIFLRAVAPYVSLQNFDNILIKHMRKAGIPLDSIKHHGLHSLRHSLATHMLDEGIPITSIQGVLGHINADSTQKYIGVNVRQLRSCALEVTD